MTTEEVRARYIGFFESKGHKRVPAAPLVLQNDPTTLFTSSGMQPLVPYLMGEKHPLGKRLVNSQPAIRTQDIEEVGDNRHTTLFEMLGNWSLGDYFKSEQLSWIWEFLTKELNLPKEKLYVSIFEGNEDVPRDSESYEIWKSLGISQNHIFEYGVKKNWWSRSGTPDNMPPGEIGGPDSEIFFEFTQVEHDPRYGAKCHPNCDCGRFIEIGNSVFIQYKKMEDGTLKEMPQQNVDFGGGLERLVAVTNNMADIFEIDVFSPLIHKIEEISGKKYKDNKKSMQIIADHTRAANALLGDGVIPSNKLQGYILRRLIRRAVIKMKNLKDDVVGDDFDKLLENGLAVEEVGRFNKTLSRGLREFGKLTNIDGKVAFDLYQTYGFPFELTLELAQEKELKVDVGEFKKAFERHQELSRGASGGVFKGGLADKSQEVVRLHTATHLLQESLRRVLGRHVVQKGSNITAVRARFDFSHSDKLSEKQIESVENMINEQIERDLEVSWEEKSLDEAKKEGALANFGERYGVQVKVCSIGDFSREVCGGPHVKRLHEIGGRVRIIKQESVSAGVRRVYLVIE